MNDSLGTGTHDGYAGSFCLVLHTHMPYVRKNGTWPVGEDWLYRAISQAYIPILGVLAQLDGEGISTCFAMTMTPVLCEQLEDDYIQERFREYLETMILHSEDDIRDFEYMHDEERRALAEAYREAFSRQLKAYKAIRGDIIGALASFEEQGMIETISSCATHAFLPGLKDERLVENQVRLGIESHRKRFGRNPSGFWVPECAYRKDLELILQSEGVEYMLTDPSSLPGRPVTCPYYAGESRVAVLRGSERALGHVWDKEMGYPTDGSYLDTTKYYLQSGLLYWRVTGLNVPIEDKVIYQPDAAKRRAFDHVEHFLDEVILELGQSKPCGSPSSGGTPRKRSAPGPSPILLANFDTELFGHGWYEGIDWLEVLFRSLAASATVKPSLPALYLENNAPVESAEVLETTWEYDKGHLTWINPRTQWMWDELDSTEKKMLRLLEHGGPRAVEPAERVLIQVLRELLILEASDWQYMVAKERAKKYATQRFRTHLDRFWKLVRALEDGKTDEILTQLEEVEELDNLFADLDLRYLWGSGSHEPESG